MARDASFCEIPFDTGRICVLVFLYSGQNETYLIDLKPVVKLMLLKMPFISPGDGFLSLSLSSTAPDWERACGVGPTPLVIRVNFSRATNFLHEITSNLRTQATTFV